MAFVPASMPSDGTLRVTFVPTFTGKLTEVSAQTAIDLSCYLTQDGFNPGTDETSVVDSRLCSKQDFEQPGRTSESLELGYVFNTLLTTDDLARSTLKKGTAGVLVVRWGLDVDDAWAVGQEYDKYVIKTGVQRKQPPEQNSVLKIMQKAFITAAVERDLKLVA